MSKEPLTEERIAEIRSRLHGVSLGEWSYGYSLDVKFNAITCEGRYLFCFVHPDPLKNEKNMEFVAHARQDMGALLAEVERLRAREDWLITQILGKKNIFHCPMPESHKCEQRDGPLCYLDPSKTEIRRKCWRKAADMETRGNPGEELKGHEQGN